MLGYHDFLDGLTRGVAAHHAGMLPAFKQVVEELFVARAVQGGLRDRDPGPRHQHAGPHRGDREAVEVERRDARRHHAGGVHPAHRPRRAPRPRRRGPRRRAVAAGHGPKQVAGLASTRTYPLRSSFRPSYNMAVNLVHQFGRERSRELLEQSFAQFQADKAVVGLARQLRKAEEALDGYAEAATCHLGDFMEYARLRRRIGDAEKAREPGPEVRPARRGAGVAGAAASPGDVIDVPAGKFSGLRRRGRPRHRPATSPRPYVVTAEPAGAPAGARSTSRPRSSRSTRLRIPKNFNGRNPQMRRDLASALRDRTHDLTPPPARERRRAAGRPGGRARSRGSAPSCGRTPATAAPTARTTPAGPSAGSSSTATPPRCGAGSSSVPTPSPASSTGSARC